MTAYARIDWLVHLGLAQVHVHVNTTFDIYLRFIFTVGIKS